METIIQVKRGAEASRLGVTPLDGEPLFASDTGKLYVGDGVTPGGIPVDTEIELVGGVGAGNIMLMADDTGSTFKGMSKADFLADYQLKVDVKDGYVPQSTVTTEASDITPDKIPTNKVVAERIGVVDERLSSVQRTIPTEAKSAVESAIPKYFQQDAMGSLGYRRVFYGTEKPNNPKEGDIFITL